MSSGRVFQTRGPATVKARLPTVESLTGGTSRRLGEKIVGTPNAFVHTVIALALTGRQF